MGERQERSAPRDGEKGTGVDKCPECRVEPCFCNTVVDPPSPYYEDEWTTIYHGDCIDVLTAVDHPDFFFDLGFADPPYNFGFDYGDGFDDKRPPDEYEAWCGEWFSALRERCGRVCITSGHGNLPQWIARKPAGIAAWYKPGNPSGAGIFQFCEWEPVFVWGKGRLGGSDVWKATLNPEFKGPAGHPCPKPELLLRRILGATRATSVIDPFMGSGTTLVAAKSMGVRAVGIERNERYCELAVKRLAQEVMDLRPVPSINVQETTDA